MAPIGNNIIVYVSTMLASLSYSYYVSSKIPKGLELEPSSNAPYRATSLQNFWARWNLLVTNTLRHTTYKPIVLACSNRKWAPLVGILGSFLVSGLMHELLVYELSRAMPTWELTSFFVIHGICVVAEMVVKRMLRWRLPDFVAIFLVNAFITVTGVWLFIPPFISARVDVKYLEEYTLVADSIKNKIHTILYV
uniref:long-chain-alcohol O-fatty-acyltransferase-like n=1 Tax=Erigeron canadensis TaxID=72917 RepID=UPI001CB8F491|nr:long-chain-alcohol O-fatty-acyltransferase-like [Erigeron canadensis]